MIAFCSMLSALSVVFMLIGIIFPTFDLAAATLASFSVILAVCELGKGYAFGVYAASSVLAIIISPQNSAAIFYAAFIGYYPLIKSIIEVRIHRRIPAIALKILCFNAALAIMLFVAVKFLSFEEFIGWYAVGFIVMAQVAFILYDIVLSKGILMYCRVLRQRLGINKLLK